MIIDYISFTCIVSGSTVSPKPSPKPQSSSDESPLAPGIGGSKPMVSNPAALLSKLQSQATEIHNRVLPQQGSSPGSGNKNQMSVSHKSRNSAPTPAHQTPQQTYSGHNVQNYGGQISHTGHSGAPIAGRSNVVKAGGAVSVDAKQSPSQQIGSPAAPSVLPHNVMEQLSCETVQTLLQVNI